MVGSNVLPCDTPSAVENEKPSTQALAIVRFAVPGFHCWQEATGERGYLADRHRHLFNVEARIELKHSCREIEFHDFLDFCRTNFPGGEMGNRSCEHMAEELIQKISDRWQNRWIQVSVFEDQEVGAQVTLC